MAELQCNQQVVWRKQMRGNLREIKIGTVLAFGPNKQTATVSFPAEHIRRVLPVDQLEPAQGVYGRARVEIHSGRRLVEFLR
jgi:hypothetical protein